MPILVVLALFTLARFERVLPVLINTWYDLRESEVSRYEDSIT